MYIPSASPPCMWGLFPYFISLDWRRRERGGGFISVAINKLSPPLSFPSWCSCRKQRRGAFFLFLSLSPTPAKTEEGRWEKGRYLVLSQYCTIQGEGHKNENGHMVGSLVVLATASRFWCYLAITRRSRYVLKYGTTSILVYYYYFVLGPILTSCSQLIFSEVRSPPSHSSKLFTPPERVSIKWMIALLLLLLCYPKNDRTCT